MTVQFLNPQPFAQVPDILPDLSVAEVLPKDYAALPEDIDDLRLCFDFFQLTYHSSLKSCPGCCNSDEEVWVTYREHHAEITEHCNRCDWYDRINFNLHVNPAYAAMKRIKEAGFSFEELRRFKLW